MKSIVITALMFTGILASHAQEKKKIESDKKNSIVSYSMKHPMHEWEANSKEVKSVIVLNSTTNTIEAIAVSIPIKSFDSGNSNRDSHAIEVLEALKYPNVSFSSSEIQESGDKITAKGNLVFHGVSKKIEISGTKKVSKGKINLIGSFQIKMTDHKIEEPGLMGIKTEDLIKLKYNLEYNN